MGICIVGSNDATLLSTNAYLCMDGQISPGLNPGCKTWENGEPSLLTGRFLSVTGHSAVALPPSAIHGLLRGGPTTTRLCQVTVLLNLIR